MPPGMMPPTGGPPAGMPPAAPSAPVEKPNDQQQPIIEYIICKYPDGSFGVKQETRAAEAQEPPEPEGNEQKVASLDEALQVVAKMAGGKSEEADEAQGFEEGAKGVAGGMSDRMGAY